jgi:hypothetical protein
MPIHRLGLRIALPSTYRTTWDLPHDLRHNTTGVLIAVICSVTSRLVPTCRRSRAPVASGVWFTTLGYACRKSGTAERRWVPAIRMSAFEKDLGTVVMPIHR